ncbi:acyltransferase family protein [uncultured Roseibium sp.]|uniref:acyltransferase family protein n=1 Tax=uncultured Roseibium sp. TaxID=1936171 RepID=UPI0032177519
MTDKNREAWVDIAKGLSIILVVMMYAAYNTGEYTGETGYLHYVIGFATPFRMPEFFLISGLFLSKVIDRPWRRYADRRVVHYFYFYGLWAAIMIALKVGIFSRSPAAMTHDMAVAVVQPYGVLWFIYMLGVFSLVAKLCRQVRIPHWVVVPVAAALQMMQIESASYVVQQFAAHFIFFYAGYLFAPLVFRLVAWAEAHPLQSLLALAAWAVVNGLLVFSPGFEVLPMGMKMGYAAFPPLHLALALTGALALCVFGALLAKVRAMDWLRWLGEHSLVIYLAFTIPMSIVRGVALWSGLITETGAISTLVLVLSIAAPAAMYWLIRKTGMGTFLIERPAWAHITGTRPQVDSNPRNSVRS